MSLPLPDPSLQPSHGRCHAAVVRVVAALLLGSTAMLPAVAAELVIAVSRGPLALPVHVAEAQGFFAAEGVQVRTQECFSGQRCIQQLFDGKAQLATVADLPLVFHSFERADFVVLATMATSPRSSKLLVRKSSGIAAAGDLLGKRVGAAEGSSAHYFLDAYLLFNGVDPARVNRVALPPEQVAAALEHRQVDAVAVFEPSAWLAMQALGADVLVLSSPRIYTTTFNLVADRRTVATRDDELVRVLRAIEHAERFIRRQPHEAQAVMKARLGLEQAFVDAAWKDVDYRLSLDQSLLSTMENQARWALREGHIKGRKAVPNLLDFIAPTPLRMAAPGAVTLQ